MGLVRWYATPYGHVSEFHRATRDNMPQGIVQDAIALDHA